MNGVAEKLVKLEALWTNAIERPDDTTLVTFAVGVGTGLLVGHAAMRLPGLMLVALLVLAVLAIHSLWAAGVPGLIDHFATVAAWAMTHFTFVKGLTSGKLLAALLHMSSRRSHR